VASFAMAVAVTVLVEELFTSAEILLVVVVVTEATFVTFSALPIGTLFFSLPFILPGAAFVSKGSFFSISLIASSQKSALLLPVQVSKPFAEVDSTAIEGGIALPIRARGI